MKNFNQKIQDLKNDYNALGDLLIDNAKQHPETIKQYEYIYASYLKHKHWYLKKAAIYALLFIDKNKKYVKEAINILKNENEDEETRSWAGTSLATMYYKTKDVYLMSLFMEIINDEKDNELVRVSCFRGILEVYGISTREMMLKAKKSDDNIDFIFLNQKVFSKELKEIEQLSKNL